MRLLFLKVQLLNDQRNFLQLLSIIHKDQYNKAAAHLVIFPAYSVVLLFRRRLVVASVNIYALLEIS
jgi:hypothetical protein